MHLDPQGDAFLAKQMTGEDFFRPRVHEKFYTRSMGVLDCEYWYRGECFGVHEATHGAVHFAPLFLSEEGKGVSVYYDLTDPHQDPRLLIEYFLRRPRAFDDCVEQYRQTIRDIDHVSRTLDVHSFPIMFQLLEKMWPGLAVVMVVGGFESEDPAVTRLAEKAMSVRKETDHVAYDASDALFAFARMMRPENADCMSCLTFREIESGDIPREEELKQRKRSYMVVEGKLSSGISFDTLEQYGFSIKKDVYEQSKELKGSVACKGIVRGLVKIVMEISQIGKVADGDILVSPMTVPDFLPAMQRAAAFVTDEGGITCHAAIVAREMNKPCVIGTKVATDVFYDGDLVEVDANTGMVRIVEHTLL